MVQKGVLWGSTTSRQWREALAEGTYIIEYLNMLAWRTKDRVTQLTSGEASSGTHFDGIVGIYE